MSKFEMRTRKDLQDPAFAEGYQEQSDEIARCSRCGFPLAWHDPRRGCPFIFDVMALPNGMEHIKRAVAFLDKTNGLLRGLRQKTTTNDVPSTDE